MASADRQRRSRLHRALGRRMSGSQYPIDDDVIGFLQREGILPEAANDADLLDAVADLLDDLTRLPRYQLSSLRLDLEKFGKCHGRDRETAKRMVK